ncbi:MAG TPA: hypothetical protein VHM65_07910 [Candidatus Lustribacter sp.]|nr:hypothetical protein [Candidatus Lustribacter sp.]
MFGSAMVDTAIGLSFVFALAALLCTGLVELGATALRKKGKYLLRGLNDLLGAADSTVTGWRESVTMVTAGASLERPMYAGALEAGPASAPTQGATSLSLAHIMGHPLVDVLKSTSASGEKVRNPAYLSAQTFSAVLVDLLVPASGGHELADLKTAVQAMTGNPTLKRSLSTLLTTAGDLATFRAGLERWYDEHMDRVGAAYTRWARRWCVVIALGLAGVFGIDALAIGTTLYTDPVVRQTVVAAATADGASALCGTSTTLEDRTACVDKALAKLGGAGIPLGWGEQNRPADPIGWVTKLFGIVLTALAARLGAPFWFNAIGRLGVVRRTSGDRPAEAAG